MNLATHDGVSFQNKNNVPLILEKNTLDAIISTSTTNMYLVYLERNNENKHIYIYIYICVCVRAQVVEHKHKD